jgi:peroxiredoxin
MPSVQRAFTDFQGKNVRVLAISIDERGAKDVKPFLAEHHYTMPVLLDTNSDTLTKYGLFGTPGTFIADAQGNLVAKAVGPVDFDRPEFRTYILDLAAGRGIG